MISDKEIITVVIQDTDLIKAIVTGLKSFSGTNLFLPEIIKVRGRILHIGLITLKLFFDIVPSSSTDTTRTLRGCFRGGSVYVGSFRFKEWKTSNALEMSSLIF